MIDYFDRAIQIRKNLMNSDNQVLCADFEQTVQKKDIHRDLIKDVISGKYMYRAKINCKTFDSEIRAKDNLPPFDFDNNKAILDVLKSDDNFDIPLWFLRKAKDDLKNIVKYDCPLIYQIKGCNFNTEDASSGCVFCFVDNSSNNALREGGEYLSVNNVVETFAEYRKNGYLTLRTSGGEPTVILDHILNLYRELDKGSIPIYCQFDSNLSTYRLIKKLESEGIYEPFIMNKIAEYDPKVLVAFKGTCDSSIQNNTQSNLTLNEQIISLASFVEAGIDVYPYLYAGNPETMKDFLIKLDSMFENILLKLHIGKLKTYTPTLERVKLIAAQDNQNTETAIESYQSQLDNNFEKCKEILSDVLNEYYGVGYKDVERPGIKLSIKDISII